MEQVHIKDEYIKLEQAMKLSGACSLGSDAKYAIRAGLVQVNKTVELQRGKKLRKGDVFSYEGHDYRILGIE